MIDAIVVLSVCLVLSVAVNITLGIVLAKLTLERGHTDVRK